MGTDSRVVPGPGTANGSKREWTEERKWGSVSLKLGQWSSLAVEECGEGRAGRIGAKLTGALREQAQTARACRALVVSSRAPAMGSGVTGVGGLSGPSFQPGPC